jgi:hypothetical protein
MTVFNFGIEAPKEYLEAADNDLKVSELTLKIIVFYSYLNCL